MKLKSVRIVCIRKLYLPMSGENMNENGMLSQLGMLYEYIMNGLYRFSS